MRKYLTTPAVLLLAFALASCAGSAPTEFGMTPGKLKEGEIPLESFGQTAFKAQVFDVVNQDLGAESNTGIAGHVEPMPADILSAYAAKKFRATGGSLSTRFVIRKASITAQPVEVTEKGWLWDNSTYKAELTADLSVALVASRADGMSARIEASTTQTQQVKLSASSDERRKAYLLLMSRALEALDGEINKELPQWFGQVVQR
jgi:hypothetical protein